MLHQGGEPRGSRVPARSPQKIRYAAERVRETLGLDGPQIDVQRFLEHDMFEHLGVVFHVAECNELGDNEALTFPDRDEILIREDVYAALCRGEPRPRFTVIHEFAHWLLHPGLALARGPARPSHRFYEDSEWQADTFAAEFLMPARLVIEHCKTATQIAALFGVSMDAAIVRMNTLKAEGLMRR